MATNLKPQRSAVWSDCAAEVRRGRTDCSGSAKTAPTIILTCSWPSNEAGGAVRIRQKVPDDPPNRKSTHPGEQRVTQPIHVLMVDDDEIQLEVSRELLEPAGYRVSTRTQALGTPEWIAEHAPDIVMLDVMMPALSGVQLAGFLMQRKIHTGIILYSSKSQQELKELSMGTNIIGAITKGVDDKEFRQRFDSLVQMHLQRRLKR